ncbi:ferredoxin [Psychromonas sp. CNPT3]|uniref:class I ribonucleotide reductase maintenance protein YfaE n=1 Tax=Psychromonas sp. CNPT3 TaxID=314282 RepID=UPI00006E2D3F|nr:class I ribonucleotide reductase maintenance protein YfaE [Psychromonas sp. CNPT3]AGH80600.1 ferredoxin [Psychromonas sp. CNPT3]
MTFICTINKQHYLFDKQKSLLENLEAHALSPEFQCRDGHCGACRCLLIKGQVNYPNIPLVYLRNNEILTCCSRADANIEIAL